MIIKTYIAKNTEFSIDTEKMVFDNKGKIVGVGNIKFTKKQMANIDFYKESYGLVEINGFFYEKQSIAAFIRRV